MLMYGELCVAVTGGPAVLEWCAVSLALYGQQRCHLEEGYIMEMMIHRFG